MIRRHAISAAGSPRVGRTVETSLEFALPTETDEITSSAGLEQTASSGGCVAVESVSRTNTVRRLPWQRTTVLCAMRAGAHAPTAPSRRLPSRYARMRFSSSSSRLACAVASLASSSSSRVLLAPVPRSRCLCCVCSKFLVAPSPASSPPCPEQSGCLQSGSSIRPDAAKCLLFRACLCRLSEALHGDGDGEGG